MVRSGAHRRLMVTEERALVSVMRPTASSGVRIEHWRYTAAFCRGPGRPCHTLYLNPPGIRYEGRIADRQVRYDGAQHSIGIVPAGVDCRLQVQASSWDVFALSVEPDRYSAFALNAGLPTAGINEDLIDGDATMHHLCRALASSSEVPGSSGAMLWEANFAIDPHLPGRPIRTAASASAWLARFGRLVAHARLYQRQSGWRRQHRGNGRHRRPQSVPFQPDLRPRNGTFAASLRHARPRRAGGSASTRKLATPGGDRFPNGLRRSEPHGATCSTVPRHSAQGASAGRCIQLSGTSSLIRVSDEGMRKLPGASLSPCDTPRPTYKQRRDTDLARLDL